MAEPTPTALRTKPAERMRISRQRRRDGMRCVSFEVRDEEIENLVKFGFLDPANCHIRQAIALALGAFLDRLPPAIWQAMRQQHSNK